MRTCRLHVSANGLLGNALDVAIAAMVYGKLASCNVSYSFAFAAGKRKSSWDEIYAIAKLQIEPNVYARQEARPPEDLPYVCPWRYVRGRPERGGYIESCEFTSSTPEGLTIVHGNNVAVTSYTAFRPPSIPHAQFLREYARMARKLRVTTCKSGPFHNLSYYQPCLGRPMISAHLRTGRTTHDLKCSTQRGKSRDCHPANETRFDIPLDRVALGARLAATRHSTPHKHIFVAFDDRTHPSDPRYSGYSTLDALGELFPSAWYTTSAIRALWAFEDHRLLSTSVAIVTYEFSSFSWTAAQMGGIPYYVLHCTEKCRQYSCSSCASMHVGVQVLSIGSASAETHRTGRPLDSHHGERRGTPVASVEPRRLPWRYDGCHKRQVTT